MTAEVATVIRAAVSDVSEQTREALEYHGRTTIPVGPRGGCRSVLCAVGTRTEQLCRPARQSIAGGTSLRNRQNVGSRRVLADFAQKLSAGPKSHLGFYR